MSHEHETTDRLSGDGVAADASWEWDAYEADGYGFVELTVTFGGVEGELTMTVETAERFVVEGRDAIAAALEAAFD